MSYTINNADGSSLVVIPDTQINTDYGITLIGRNYSGYGVFLNDNFISIMENFAKPTAPATPLTGQLWFNTTTNLIQVWQGSTWKTLSFTTVSGTPPTTTGITVGDLWWDNSNYQLNVWGGLSQFAGNATATSTGNVVNINFSTSSLIVGDAFVHPNVNPFTSTTIKQILNSSQVVISSNVWVSINEPVIFTQGVGWSTIGPAYTAGQGKTGVVPTTVIDTSGFSHSISISYNAGIPTAIFSKDIAFTPAANNLIPGFTVINPGITTASSSSIQIAKTVLSGTNDAGSTLITLSTVADLVVGDYFVSNTVALSSYASISALYPNNVVQIGITTTVDAGDTITFQRGVGAVGNFNGTSTNSLGLNGLARDAFAQLSIDNTFQQDITIDGNLYVNDFQIWNNSGDLNLTNPANDGDFNFYSNVSGVETRSLYIEGPTGRVQVNSDPTVALGVATKQYVDTADQINLTALTANVTALRGATSSFGSLSDASNTANAISSSVTTLTNDVALKAYAQDAALTGVPTAPTASAGTNTTQLATTAFTTDAVLTLNNSQTVLLALKAPLANPALTGVPTAPTAVDYTSTTQIATTRFVANAINNQQNAVTATLLGYATLVGSAFSGAVTGLTRTAGDSTTNFATTAFVTNAVTTSNTSAFANLASTNATLNALSLNLSTNYAPLVSPSLTGVPLAPTVASTADTSTKIATTAFVQNHFNAFVPGTYAPLASPALTGNPTAPTPSAGDSDTSIATTAFVTHAVTTANTAAFANLATTNSTLTALGTNVSNNYALKASPTFTGAPIAPTMPLTTANTTIATTAFLNNFFLANISGNYAPLVSPTLTGTPIAPTATTGTNTTQLATTAFVQTQLAATIPVWTVVGRTGNITLAVGDITGAAPIDNPVFTGIPQAPTAAQTVNNSQVATTFFVNLAVNNLSTAITNTLNSTYAPLASPALTGNPTAPTRTAGDNDTSIATTEFVTTAVATANTVAFANLGLTNSTLNTLSTNVINNYAPLASPALTGVPTAPTAATNTNTTQIATTAFVRAQLTASIPVTSVAGKTGTVTLAVGDISGAAPLASPALTGTPTAPTASSNSNSTQLATTAFVQTAVTGLATSSGVALTYAPLASPALTGLPTAPTASSGTNTTQVATTAFVATAIQSASVLWMGSTKFVSTAAPTSGQGANGDIWFQI